MKPPFTAVAIRYVHDPRTEEFLNIGLVLFCERHRFAGPRSTRSDALAILEDTVRSQASVLTEDESDALVAQIEADLHAHEDAGER